MFEVDDSINKKTFGECPDCHRALCLYCVNKWHPGKGSWAHLGAGCGGTERLSKIQCIIDKDCPIASSSHANSNNAAERKKQVQREQSVAARKLAEQNGWCRCPKCKQMVVREVSNCVYSAMRCWAH